MKEREEGSSSILISQEGENHFLRLVLMRNIKLADISSNVYKFHCLILKKDKCLNKVIHQITRNRRTTSLQQFFDKNGLNQRDSLLQRFLIITNGNNVTSSVKLLQSILN